MMSIIAIPFGWLMKLCYFLVDNYAIALILFTFITKLLMFPLNIKQQKATAKTAKLNPKLQQLQKKYANNKEKYSEEVTKLYAEEGVSMSSGCLPLIVNMVLLFAMIEIIYAPLTYVTDVNSADVEEARTLVSNVMTVSNEIEASSNDDADTFNEIIKVNDVTYTIGGSEEENEKAVNTVYKYLVNDDNKKIFKNTRKLSEQQVKDVVEVLFEYNEKGLYEYITDNDKVTPKLQSRPELLIFRIVEDGMGDFLPESVVKAADDFNYEILGIFLGDYPSWSSILVLIPVISLVFQLLVTFVSQHYSKKNNPNAQASMGGMNIMLYCMPLVSFAIAFGFPAGIGLYWIAQSVFSLVQVIVVNKIYTPEYIDKLNEKDKAKRKKKGKKSFMEKALEAQMQTQGGVSKDTSPKESDEDSDGEDKKLSKAELKELQRKKLNEARKRMAEKYGDEYKED